MNCGMVREDSDPALEATHFAYLQQNKNILTNNVLWKRKEQLLKWETSETNRLPAVRKLNREPKVKFTDEDVFLSACLGGDLDEVQMLLDNGANINTTTVDGLTALHQAVIDGKAKMVQYLVEHGANVNAQDNEGWTPLHAAACCGNDVLVEYLCTEGADLSITNNDKKLAVDLAEEDDCRLALEEEHRRQGINPDECRNRELMMMRRDAEQWLKDGEIRDCPHARTGATALHVAAAKGYNDVLRLLLRAGADVNCRDRDGWTPLHAAAHWGQHEAAAILIQNGASFAELTNSGETVLNLADKGIVEFLEGMQEKERLRLTSSNSVNVLVHANTQLKRASSTTSVLRMSTEEKTKKTKMDEQDESKELREGRYSFIIEDKSPSPSVEVRLPIPVKQQQRETSESLSEEERSCSKMSTEGSSEEKSSLSAESKNSDTEIGSFASESISISESEQKRDSVLESKVTHVPNSITATGSAPVVSAKTTELKCMPEIVRQSTSVSSSTNSTSTSRSASIESNSVSFTSKQNQSWLKPQSLEKDLATVTTTTTGSLDPSIRSNKHVSVQRSTSTPVPWMPLYRSSAIKGALHPAFAHFQAAVQQASAINKTPSVTNASLLQSAISPLSRNSIPTPPTEPNLPNESEAERRSKAKRQRDSRRSTQGVTREQLRATSLTVRSDDKDREKENETHWNGKSISSSSSLETNLSEEIEKRIGDERKDSESKICSPSQVHSAVRRRSQGPRPSRRVTGPIQIDDLQTLDEITDDTAQKSSGDMSSAITTPTSTNADVLTPVAATTSYNLRDNVLTTAAYTQAAVTSRGKPITQTNSIHIGGSGTVPAPFQTLNNKTNCQDMIDYKALYEKERQETERLRRRVEELSLLETLQKTNSANNIALIKRTGGRTISSSLTKSPSTASLEDRERRIYEQRIAEMQYEIEQLEHLRADNQKLKEENGALIRVISKLSK